VPSSLLFVLNFLNIPVITTIQHKQIILQEQRDPSAYILIVRGRNLSPKFASWHTSVYVLNRPTCRTDAPETSLEERPKMNATQWKQYAEYSTLD